VKFDDTYEIKSKCIVICVFMTRIAMLFFKIRDFDDLSTKAIMKESDAFACVLIYRINNILGG